ncbi:hypothetical protein [Streptomyces rishiriensis]|uniref:hypothetical protein n=1 Tax=Streptomyces rishiriensis TaxID=68264 RepID=UPI000D5910C4|nr:hypothetical protein [Streptomyces rishiriensis]
MNHTTNPTAVIYDALEGLQGTTYHLPPGTRQAVAEHLARVLPAVSPSAVVSADRATLLLWAADQIDAETRQAKAYGVLEPDKFRPCRDASAQLRALAGCASCEVGIEHDVHCPTPESHGWGCGCLTDGSHVAAEEQPAETQAEHVCKPGAGMYFCPTSGKTESTCHGGFDVCCDRPELHKPAETPASTAPLAAGLPLVKGRCPACGRASLFLGNGGYVTCSVIECAEPDAASTLLEPAEPWLTDSARIGRALIWSWSDVGKGAFGEGYRAAQAEARALLGGGRGTEQQRPAVREQPDTQTREARLVELFVRYRVQLRDNDTADWKPSHPSLDFEDREDADESAAMGREYFPSREYRVVTRTTTITEQP